ncbi:MAG: DnaJ domain-containing protein [Spirochaetaceae bacterium]|jgi:curved DNA-binding protein CbpA|nr:DnaJ domain-containing protein [Spirochaetaceae bacterium]
MENYYTLLNIDRTASGQDIKRAFRERAKMFHPDIAGKNAEAQMRRLLAAYQVLSSPDRRFEYDRAYERFIGAGGFDYRNFLKEREGDPASQAKLVFFLLLHMEDGEALEIWKKIGGLDFPPGKIPGPGILDGLRFSFGGRIGQAPAALRGLYAPGGDYPGRAAAALF